MKDFVFEKPLREGVIAVRRGPMALEAELAGAAVSCHYPARGRLSGIRLEGRPCLLSRSDSLRRRTEYTVEALSLQRPEDEKKRWIGINPSAVRAYAAHYVPRREFSRMLNTTPKSGEAAMPGAGFLGLRVDFRLGNTFVKLLSPMAELKESIPPWVRVQPKTAPPFGARMVRQLEGVSGRMRPGQRLIVLLCYLYDSPPETLCPRGDPAFLEVREALRLLRLRGIEIWQANFRVEPERVWLIRNFPILPENADGTKAQRYG